MDRRPGYGFRPYDDELVGFHLRNKILGVTEHVEEDINEVDICSFDPRDLRFQSKIKSRDLVWYFYSRRHASGNQQNRTTKSGFWKLTGDPVAVKDRRGDYCGIPGQEIGHKRVLGFHKGTSSNPRSSKGTKSDWVIHEYHCTLLPPHKRTYVICRLEYKGHDINILSYNPTHPYNNSPGSVVDQSLQGNSASHNTFSEYDSANQDQLFTRNFNMPQSVQGNSGSFNYISEYGSPNQDQWFMQQQFPYSALYEDPQMIWNHEVRRNYESLVDERTDMQENCSAYRPKNPVTRFLPDDSGDSDTDSTICGDSSSSTDSGGSSNGPYHTPVYEILSLRTIEPLHSYEAQEQPKQLNLQLQGKEKVLNKHKSECEWKMAQHSVKEAPSTTPVKQSWIVLEEINQRNSQWIYLKNTVIGFFLFIAIIGWIILVG